MSWGKVAVGGPVAGTAVLPEERVRAGIGVGSEGGKRQIQKTVQRWK